MNPVMINFPSGQLSPGAPSLRPRMPARSPPASQYRIVIPRKARNSSDLKIWTTLSANKAPLAVDSEGPDSRNAGNRMAALTVDAFFAPTGRSQTPLLAPLATKSTKKSAKKISFQKEPTLQERVQELLKASVHSDILMLQLDQKRKSSAIMTHLSQNKAEISKMQLSPIKLELPTTWQKIAKAKEQGPLDQGLHKEAKQDELPVQASKGLNQLAGTLRLNLQSATTMRSRESGPRPDSATRRDGGSQPELEKDDIVGFQQELDTAFALEQAAGKHVHLPGHRATNPTIFPASSEYRSTARFE